MHAIDRHFTKIINGTTQFVIPVFQRDYSWTEAECEQLWKDIVHAGADPGDRSHFLGSVVYVSTGDTAAGFTRWLLIDGQQRVTSLTLLVAALRDHIKSSGWTGTEGGPTAKRLDAYFLRNLQEEGNRLHKLVLRRHDQATLQAILDEGEPPANPSDRVRDNYDFFRERVAGADPEVIYAGVGRLVVVDVSLDHGDNPQLIFESLNSTGIDLSQADLIRNFILMRLPERQQTRLYEEYWARIENLFRGSEKTFDSFVRDYLALRAQASKQDKANEIYFAFRRQFNSLTPDEDALDALLKELLRFARYHAAFSIGVGAESPLREPLARLRRLVDVPAMLLMQLFDYRDRLGSLTDPEFVEAIELIESYVFRRAICSEQTHGYWQIFASLAYRLDPAKPLESLKVGFAQVREAYGFPDDAAFEHALESEDVYRKRVKLELLERLENHENREPTDITKVTIEHVMPQNEDLVRAWREMLGAGWRDVHRVWLHRLGNLTLTGYNSTYSDRPFEEKKTIQGGFNESAARLNRFVREQTTWNAGVMEGRGKELAKRARSIWPPLVVAPVLIEAARQNEVRERARRRDVTKVPMSAEVRALFDILRPQLRALGDDVVELAEEQSISYHGPAFFLEVLPRAHRLNLLLALDFAQVDDPSGLAQDAAQWKWITNAQYEGGVNIRISTADDIEKAMPMVRQARARAAS